MVDLRFFAVAVLASGMAAAAGSQPLSVRPTMQAGTSAGTAVTVPATTPVAPRPANGGNHPVSAQAAASAAQEASAAAVAAQTASGVRPTTRNAQGRQATTATQEASGAESNTVELSPTGKAAGN